MITFALFVSAVLTVSVCESAARIRSEVALISAWQDSREMLVWVNRRYLGRSP